ncbi:YqkE family protein [Planococcus sp. CP5-4]|uniref:YqkE family protein n=1 Tax=unclassified Planococcus (in: firmicutes) TaxID=2662419 RepID=UPI001C22B7E6|nr:MULTISPECIES: YqkE family protein [unclassified Planococcus (in: firmicutes)]MBU9672013.1 YqkE family protein [Planococcus sp. CP5-4_YE]MBV0907576.1 YqkE family protein [Planococcus sp. CP5-4_UN]MBW6062743.1 YqkE family protein [Planococcus sp. CP5-4]
MAKEKHNDNGLFSEDQLLKLKAAKKELVKDQQKLEEEKEAQRQFERKEREKNLSFEELLERHGDSGTKY